MTDYTEPQYILPTERELIAEFDAHIARLARENGVDFETADVFDVWLAARMDRERAGLITQQQDHLRTIARFPDIAAAELTRAERELASATQRAAEAEAFAEKLRDRAQTMDPTQQHL